MMKYVGPMDKCVTCIHTGPHWPGKVFKCMNCLSLEDGPAHPSGCVYSWCNGSPHID